MSWARGPGEARILTRATCVRPARVACVRGLTARQSHGWGDIGQHDPWKWSAPVARSVTWAAHPHERDAVLVVDLDGLDPRTMPIDDAHVTLVHPQVLGEHGDDSLVCGTIDRPLANEDRQQTFPALGTSTGWGGPITGMCGAESSRP